MNHCICGKDFDLELTGTTTGPTWLCHCTRCRKACMEDGHVIYVRGYGDTPEDAKADWNARLRTF